MFHFSNRQLNIIISFLVVSMLLIVTFLVVRNNDAIILKGKVYGLNSFSDGWIASYETLDEAKWRKYGDTDDKEAKWNITEVLNLPNTFDIKADKYVTLTHKIPDFSDEEEYLVFNSKDQFIQITANRDLIYESGENGMSFPYHIITIDHQYANGSITFKVKSNNKDRITLDEIRIGNYTELISASLKDNGWFVVYGVFLILLSVSLLAVITSAKSKAPKKYLLKYIGGEALFAGILFVIESTLFRTLIHWEMLNYFLRAVVIIIVTVFHLFVIRCMINRVKILTVIDFGIIIYCI